MIEKKRKTKETNILIQLKTKEEDVLVPKLKVGVPFFEHMLNALLFYAKLEMHIYCEGDLDVDAHHSLEDIGIVLGDVIQSYYGEINKFKRFSSCYAPIDETLVRTVLDISGRPYFQIEGIDLYALTSLEQSLLEFLRALAINAKLTVHVDVIRGFNRHHIFEAIFKSFGMCLYESMVMSDEMMSTKGSIG